jgi:hypothetical protein
VANHPGKRTVLLLAANPASTDNLDLEVEGEAIAQCLQRARGQHDLQLASKYAVTDDDLRRALLDHQPAIVHFSGHGAGKQGLVFEEDREPLLISGAALADLLGLCTAHVKCVVLNACYSDVQAQPISAVVEHVVGMSRAIGDPAAIKFSTGFYDALASGRPYTDAFRFGCNAISLKGLPESLTPTLIVNSRVQSGKTLEGVTTGSAHPGASIRDISEGTDASVHDLISLLDFRADMVLAQMARDEPQSPNAAGDAAPESARDMTMAVQSTPPVDDLGREFAQLHERNKKALIDGDFVLSHEITRHIQELLHDTRLFMRSSLRYAFMYSKMAFFSHFYVSGSMYPGPLPQSLKKRPNPVVQMWKEEADEQKRVREERAAAGARHASEVAERIKWQQSDAKALRTEAIAKGVRLGGDRCPYCHFSYAWDGMDCQHCRFQDV